MRPPRVRGTAPTVVRERIFQAVRAVIRAVRGNRPTVLAVEDVHWADPTTAEMLGRLIAEPEPGVLLVITHRESAEHWPAASGAASIRLDPLARQHVVQLADEIAGAPLPARDQPRDRRPDRRRAVVRQRAHPDAHRHRRARPRARPFRAAGLAVVHVDPRAGTGLAHGSSGRARAGQAARPARRDDRPRFRPRPALGRLRWRRPRGSAGRDAQRAHHRARAVREVLCVHPRPGPRRRVRVARALEPPHSSSPHRGRPGGASPGRSGRGTGADRPARRGGRRCRSRRAVLA